MYPPHSSKQHKLPYRLRVHSPNFVHATVLRVYNVTEVNESLIHHILIFNISSCFVVRELFGEKELC